jgi:hypothetical protein
MSEYDRKFYLFVGMLVLLIWFMAIVAVLRTSAREAESGEVDEWRPIPVSTSTATLVWVEPVAYPYPVPQPRPRENEPQPYPYPAPEFTPAPTWSPEQAATHQVNIVETLYATEYAQLTQGALPTSAPTETPVDWYKNGTIVVETSAAIGATQFAEFEATQRAFPTSAP